MCICFITGAAGCGVDAAGNSSASGSSAITTAKAGEDDPLMTETEGTLGETTAPSATMPDVVDNDKLIALTFDDGPSGNTDRLLDLLERHNMKATFFVVASRVENGQYGKVINRIYDDGHEIASHTYNHPTLTKMTSDEILAELDKSERIISEATGGRATVRLLRPPGGNYNDTVRAVCRQKDWRIVNWSVDTRDWENRKDTNLVNRIVETSFQEGAYGIQDGAIVLYHDLYESTIDAVEIVLDRLQSEGYTCVTVSQLLALRDGGGTAGELYTKIK